MAKLKKINLILNDKIKKNQFKQMFKVNSTKNNKKKESRKLE
jgi:hypothetical protein